MVFKMHRVTSDVSPTDKGRLTPCLNPHAKYIVHSSNGTTHDLFYQKWEFLFIESNGCEVLIETFHASANKTLPFFVKIMQSFILMQNT